MPLQELILGNFSYRLLYLQVAPTEIIERLHTSFGEKLSSEYASEFLDILKQLYATSRVSIQYFQHPLFNPRNRLSWGGQRSHQVQHIS